MQGLGATSENLLLFTVGAQARFPNLPDFALKAVQGLSRDFRESVGFRPKGCVRGSGSISENLVDFALKAV